MQQSNILGGRMAGPRDLVPPAERPFAPNDHDETVEETIWRNVTSGDDLRDVAVDVYVGMQRGLQSLAKKRPLSWEERTGKRRYIVRASGQCLLSLRGECRDVGQPGPSLSPKGVVEHHRGCRDPGHPKTTGERAIPSEFDLAIQHYECVEVECSQKKMACKNTHHRKTIVGGLAPHDLVNIGQQSRPVISQALDDLAAQKAEAEQKTIQALLAKSDNEAKLAEAQAEVERLRKQISASVEAQAEDVEARTRPVRGAPKTTP
jgi:hypothetical protein